MVSIEDLRLAEAIVRKHAEDCGATVINSYIIPDDSAVKVTAVLPGKITDISVDMEMGSVEMRDADE